MSKQIIPHDRKAYLMPIGTTGLKDPRMKQPGAKRELLDLIAPLSMVPTIFITVLVCVNTGSGDDPLNPFAMSDTTWNLPLIALAVATFVATWTLSMIGLAHANKRSFLKALDERYVQNAKQRVYAVINGNTMRDEDEEHAYFARALIANPDEQPFGRELLVRLDAVAVRLDETIDKVCHDKKLERRARDVAYRASMDLIASIRVQAAAHLDVAAVDDLTRDVRAIVDGREIGTPTLSYAPSARISRIIATAERMLASHPDLADAGGARIDALVRVHVPRLLDRHRIAAETASPDALDAVDAQLETGVEAIRHSVQEAADAVHDEAMTALATELRFLELRRSTAAPLLTAVSR